MATEKNPEITLTLEDGLFADKVTADEISLSGSFNDMRVGKIQSKGNQLNLKLRGKAEEPEGQGFFVDGIIGISSSAMENEHASASVTIPIQQRLIAFESSEMTVDGSTVTVPLTVIGQKDLGKLTLEDIKFLEDDTLADDGEQPNKAPAVKVTQVEKTESNRLALTMNIKGVTDKNSAAEALDGRMVQLGDTEFLSKYS